VGEYWAPQAIDLQVVKFVGDCDRDEGPVVKDDRSAMQMAVRVLSLLGIGLHPRKGGGIGGLLR